MLRSMMSAIVGQLRHAAEVRRGSAALLVDGHSVTYRELLQLVDDRRRSLAQQKVGERDVVAVATSASVDFIATYFALMSLAAATVPLLPDTCAGISNNTVSDYGLTKLVDGSTVIPLSPRSAWRDSFSRKTPVACIQTTGTTGTPKLCAHTEAGLLYGLWNTCSVADEAILGSATVPKTIGDLRQDLHHRLHAENYPQLRFNSSMPMATIAALTVVHRALLLGDTLVLHEALEVGELLSVIREQQVTNIGLPPLLAERMARHLNSHMELGSDSLLHIGIGGSRVPPSLVARLEELTGCLVTVGYGSTEAGGVLCMGRPNQSLETRCQTVGKPLPSVRIRIAPEPGSHQGEGRLHFASPAAMAGTISSGEFFPVAGWVDSGDLASVDSAGNLRILGRADWTIMRAGHRIDPSEIEAALEAEPGVGRAAVMPTPSRVPGEFEIVALVTPQPGIAASPSVLRRSVAAKLGRTKTPREIHFVSDLPTTVDGSVQRHRLTIDYAAIRARS